VVSSANLRNATIADPVNDKIYSNGTSIYVGRFAISAGVDDIRVGQIRLENIGTSNLSLLGSSTGVQLWSIPANTLVSVGTISGQTMTFS
jgi:hypothetical protein